MAPIATCVLGVGLSGLTFHIPFLLALPDLFSLHSVLERNPKNPGGRVKERFGVDVKIHRSFEGVINDNEIELIIVGTPNETHYNFVKAFNKRELLTLEETMVDRGLRLRQSLGELRDKFDEYVDDSDDEGSEGKGSADETEWDVVGIDTSI